MESDASPNAEDTPYLVHFAEGATERRRIVLDPLPFRIGRSRHAGFTVFSREVSKEHAEVYRNGNQYYVRDLGSTNGTFVNGIRITNSPLSDGDVLHVAHKEFVFGLTSDHPSSSSESGTRTVVAEPEKENLITGWRLLDEMVAGRMVHTAFQPVIDLASRMPIGWEALGRCDHPVIGPSPLAVFQMAEKHQRSTEISSLFRDVAIEESVHLPRKALLFVNTHPDEITDALLDEIIQLQSRLQNEQQLVLEVHEGAVTDIDEMKRIRDGLQARGIGLAYDDFGAGQARLMELVEVPPDFIKLDVRLVRDIDTSSLRQGLIVALIRIMRDLNIKVLAEGVETEGEALCCQQIGCQYAQGYLFGRPVPVDQIVAPEA